MSQIDLRLTWYPLLYRFLCPPPTAIMIGNSWWSDVQRRGEEPKLCPPRVVISISGEPAPQEGSVEWTSATGKAFDVSDPPTGTTYIGRCVGKQLFISDVDEKKKKVEALVKIMAPSSEDEPERVIGTFPSRPIKVISKPSKKRQSAKNLECTLLASLFDVLHLIRRLFASVYQPRIDDIVVPSTTVPNGFDKVPLRIRLWVVVQGIGWFAIAWFGPTVTFADAFLYRANCKLG
jgi:hypothetical protein